MAEFGTWISVKDRSPEGRSFIAADSNGDVGEAFQGDDDYYYWMEDCRDYEFAESIDITHWMPLPEPPGKEDA